MRVLTVIPTLMFRSKESIYTYINCAPTDFVDLQSKGVDVLVNGIQEYLVEIEIINNLLREDRHLRGRKTIFEMKTV